MQRPRARDERWPRSTWEHPFQGSFLCLVLLIAAALCVPPDLHAAAFPGGGGALAPVVDQGAAETPPAHLLAYRETRGAGKYWEWLWKDPVNLVTRPAYWRGDEWRTVALEAGVTGVAIPLDNPARDLFQNNRSGSLDSTLNTVRDITGKGGYYFAAGAALFGSGLIGHNERLADSGFLAVEATAYADALAQGIKLLTGRDRPDVADDQYQFHGPGRGPSNSAFVSGESTVAFAFASSVSEVWGNPWVTWPAYGLAVAVSAERMNQDRHWLSDVVGGAFLGEMVGEGLVHLHYHHHNAAALQAYVTPDAAGLDVTFRF